MATVWSYRFPVGQRNRKCPCYRVQIRIGSGFYSQYLSEIYKGKLKRHDSLVFGDVVQSTI